MRQKSRLFLCVGCIILALKNFQINAEEPSPQTKQAVLETSKANGFMLSEKAIQTLGVSTKEVEVTGQITLPKYSIVHSLDRVGVYRLRGGWFKLIPIERKSLIGSQVTVRTPELKAGDRVAIKGVALLRVSEMEAFGGGE